MTTQDFAQNLRDTVQVRKKEETSERVSNQARDLLRTRARERKAGTGKKPQFKKEGEKYQREQEQGRVRARVKQSIVVSPPPPAAVFLSSRTLSLTLPFSAFSLCFSRARFLSFPIFSIGQLALALSRFLSFSLCLSVSLCVKRFSLSLSRSLYVSLCLSRARACTRLLSLSIVLVSLLSFSLSLYLTSVFFILSLSLSLSLSLTP